MAYAGLDISGRICLVSGGTSGIGRAIALALKDAGAKVVAGSSNAEKVAAMKNELGAGHDAVRIDVSDEDSVQGAIEHTVNRFGRLDALINAAGVIARKPSLEVTTAEFERIVKINLTGSFIVGREAIKVMKNQSPDVRGQRGSIIFIASLNSYISLREVLAYASSKSGVLGLVRGFANEFAELGIRVNGIAPGVFPTDLNRPLIEGTARGEWLKAHTPLGRFGDVEELCGAAIYLISPSGSFTTGETIVVDGGYLAPACNFALSTQVNHPFDYWTQM